MNHDPGVSNPPQNQSNRTWPSLKALQVLARGSQDWGRTISQAVTGETWPRSPSFNSSHHITPSETGNTSNTSTSFNTGSVARTLHRPTPSLPLAASTSRKPLTFQLKPQTSHPSHSSTGNSETTTGEAQRNSSSLLASPAPLEALKLSPRVQALHEELGIPLPRSPRQSLDGFECLPSALLTESAPAKLSAEDSSESESTKVLPQNLPGLRGAVHRARVFGGWFNMENNTMPESDDSVTKASAVPAMIKSLDVSSSGSGDVGGSANTPATPRTTVIGNGNLPTPISPQQRHHQQPSITPQTLNGGGPSNSLPPTPPTIRKSWPWEQSRSESQSISLVTSNPRDEINSPPFDNVSPTSKISQSSSTGRPTHKPLRMSFLTAIARLAATAPPPMPHSLSDSDAGKDTPDEELAQLLSDDINAMLNLGGSGGSGGGGGGGLTEPFSQAQYRTLQVNAQNIIHRLQTAYRARTEELRAAEAERDSQKDALIDARSCALRLRQQVASMSAQIAEQERCMKEMSAALADDKPARTTPANVAAVATKTVNGVNGGKHHKHSHQHVRQVSCESDKTPPELPSSTCSTVCTEDLGVDAAVAAGADECKKHTKWRKSGQTDRSDLSFETDEESVEADSIFSHVGSSGVAGRTSPLMSSYALSGVTLASERPASAIAMVPVPIPAPESAPAQVTGMTEQPKLVRKRSVVQLLGSIGSSVSYTAGMGGGGGNSNCINISNIQPATNNSNSSYFARPPRLRSSTQTTFQKLIKGMSRLDEKCSPHCRNCSDRNVSVAWDTVGLLREENKLLKSRVGELEDAVGYALDVVNGVGF